jgi:quinol monooxygenase YgiN
VGRAYDTDAVKRPHRDRPHLCGFGPTTPPLEVPALNDGPDVELTVVVMRFRAADPERLLAVLSKYVVLSRGHPGCRNVDLVASVTTPGRLVVIQKWETPAAQQDHFDSAAMVEMAEACRGLLAEAPDIDLLEAISAHDLA